MLISLLHGMLCLDMIANWLVAIGTIVIALVAVFQESIRAFFYRPKFHASIKTEPPDCVALPLTFKKSEWDPLVIAQSIYLRIWVENVGNATANDVEVYAKSLHRLRADETWERVIHFPPMNLVWSNIGVIYFPRIAPDMGKHCDVGHVTDPSKRTEIGEDSMALGLTDEETSLAFNLQVAPNHKGHIVGPGQYRLEILIAAGNARPTKRTLYINLRGKWYIDQAIMLRDGVGVTIASD